MLPRAAVSSVSFINDVSLRRALAFCACGRIDLSRGIWESDRRQISDAIESRAASVSGRCRDPVLTTHGGRSRAGKSRLSRSEI